MLINFYFLFFEEYNKIQSWCFQNFVETTLVCLGLTVRTLQVYSLNHKNPHAHTLLLYVFGIYRIMFGLRMADIDSDRQKKLIYKSKRATAKYVKHTAVVFLLYFQVFRVILSKSIRSQLHVLGLLFCYFLFYLFIY